jgi:hypothetical protein
MGNEAHEPASAEQLAGAIAALGLWSGDPSTCDHDAEARRLGGPLAYRAHLANWLLGATQSALIDIEGERLDREDWLAALTQEIAVAVREGDDRALFGLLRWQALRLGWRLRELAARERSGPIVLAAAHTVEALQRQLGLLELGPLVRESLAGAGDIDEQQLLQLPSELHQAREALDAAGANLALIAGLLDDAPTLRTFTTEDLDAVERELLAAAVALNTDGGIPDSGQATLALCGALAPLAQHLREHANAATLRPHVAHLGAAAASFLISLSAPGPSPATLDSGRRHVIIAVLHGERGITRFTPEQLAGERWFLEAVQAVGELMADAAAGQDRGDRAYSSRVTRHAIQTLAICGAWLAHHLPEDP